MSAPPVPTDVDLRKMPGMQLDTFRLLNSDLFALSSGDEFKAAIALYCRSWGQVPAGSLPADDRILAALSGAGSKWKRVKAVALRGWVECDDGRLYHNVVSENAVAAWTKYSDFQHEKDAARDRKQRERDERSGMFADLRAIGHDTEWNISTSALRKLHKQVTNLSRVTGGGSHEPVTPHDTASKGKGKGKGNKSFKSSSTTNARTHSSEVGAAALARALIAVGYSDCSEHHPDLVAAAAEGHTEAELVAVATSPKGSGKGIAYLVQTVRGQRADAAERATSGNSATHAGPVINPEVRAQAEARHELDDQILRAKSDCEHGLYGDDPDVAKAERDRRIDQARQAFHERFPRRAAAPAPRQEARA